MFRRVRHVRLTCAREEHAQHGRVLLEDAMRTATLGDETRLIVVRRVNIGRVPLRASATQWSRRLEQSYREVRPIAVRHDHALSARADAVSFATVYEPWLVAAQRTVTQQQCTEWYWTIALLGWKPTLSTEQTLRLCFRSLAAHGGLRLTLLLAQRLGLIGQLTPLLEALRPEDLAPLQAELGYSAGIAAWPPETAVRERRRPYGLQSEAALLARWGADDLRTYWLAAVRIIRARASDLESVGHAVVTPDKIRALVQRWAEVPVQEPIPLSRRATERGPEATSRRIEEDRDVPERGESQLRDGVYTRAGGLFFAVPLLVRAGLPGFVATLPAQEAAVLPWHILKLVLRHSRTPDDDPLMVAMQALPPVSRQIGRWLIAANRQALRLTRLNSRQLTTRPALVSLSATHVDVFFRPADADIRIRRAGLDIDPGWVPWLGPTIAYHFNCDDGA